MKKYFMSGTLKKFILFTVIISLLFSMLMIFQSFYFILDRQSSNAQSMYPHIKTEIEKRVFSLYSGFSSNVLNAEKNLFDAINRMTVLTDTLVIIFDENGKVLSFSPYSIEMETLLKEDSTPYLQEIPVFEKHSENSSKTRVNKFIGDDSFSKLIGKDFISRSYIFSDSYNISKNDPEDLIEIAISVSTYTSFEEALFWENIRLISIPLAILFLTSLIYIVIFAGSVSKPFGELLNLAKSAEKGDFKFRIKNVKSKNEIAQISHTFNNMMERLEQIESQRAEFASNVAHELRTPMTSIGGFIEGILDGTIKEDKQTYYLERVRVEIKRLTNMIRDLLILSKIDADEGTPLEKKRFDINDLIRKSVLGFEHEIVKKKIFINVHFADESTYVYANADDIERVLINLIHNSLKFTKEGGNISVIVEPRRSKVYVHVKDSGIGMDNDEVQNIWTRFYKTDKSRSQDKTATGLGLSIVFSVIKRHNEIITVNSQKGVGTEFVFTLENADFVENS